MSGQDNPFFHTSSVVPVFQKWIDNDLKPSSVTTFLQGVRDTAESFDPNQHFSTKNAAKWWSLSPRQTRRLLKKSGANQVYVKTDSGMKLMWKMPSEDTNEPEN